MKRKKRYEFLVLILILAIGFAAVSTSLVINGTVSFNTNDDEFNVYFSNALVNGKQDLSVIENNQTITFKTELKTLGSIYTLDYDVTNGSKNYNAKLEMNCTGGNEYLTVTNEFDVSTNLSVTKTRSGKLTVELSKAYIGDAKEVSVTCTIDATAQERDTLSTEEPVQDLESQYYVGKVITLGTEKFNMISQTDDTVTMLAQYNLGEDYKQTKIANTVTFSETNGWENTPGPKEIDIQNYEGNAKTYVNEYVSFLQSKLNDNSIRGNLITMGELKNLGCTITDDYSYVAGLTCVESKNASWLVNNQRWWSISARPEYNDRIWLVFEDGHLDSNKNDVLRGIRPTITISKSTLENLNES